MSKKAAILSLIVVLGCIFAITMNVSADFKDDFTDTDYSSNGWYTNILLGKTNADFVYPARRRISFRLPNYDTALYFLNEDTNTEDSTVEATFEHVFSGNTSYGVVCRYHPYGWYEFRITVTGQFAGSYAIYKYDQYLKSQGKNPYVILTTGMDRYYSYDIKLGLNVQNTLKMSCEGDEIRVFINGVEQFPIRNGKLRDSDFTDGENGVMIWTEMPQGEAQIDITNFASIF